MLIFVGSTLKMFELHGRRKVVSLKKNGIKIPEETH